MPITDPPKSFNEDRARVQSSGGRRPMDRRDFVRATGQILLASGVAGPLASCSAASYVVKSQMGTVNVRVTGFGDGATSAGTISAVSSTGDSISIPLPTPSGGESAGSGSAPVGTYTATYSPPTGYMLTAGGNGTQTVTITDGGTTSVVYTVAAVTQSPPPQDVLFHSDWSTGTGSSASALLDSNQSVPWDTELTASAPSVISAAGFFTAGFANCFKAPVIDGGAGGKAGSVQVANEWPAPNVGDNLFYRAYLYADWPTAEVSVAFGGHHPWEAGPGTINWSVKFGHTSGSDALALHLDLGGQLAVVHKPLSFRTEYRLEMQAHIVSSSTWQSTWRIYDASGTLIRQNADFDMVNHSGYTLETWQASNDLPAPGGLAQWQKMSIGTNGLGDFNATLNDANLWGGVCLRTHDWCGPYANGV